jgi:hypothetical protein
MRCFLDCKKQDLALFIAHHIYQTGVVGPLVYDLVAAEKVLEVLDKHITIKEVKTK